MAKFSLRRYDTQARVGVIISLLSIAPLMGLVALIGWKMEMSEWVLYYGPRFSLAFYPTTLAALGLSTIGLGFGFNSAGQRRNDKQKLSWIGFFVGVAVLCLTLILFVLFRLRAEPVVI